MLQKFLKGVRQIAHRTYLTPLLALLLLPLGGCSGLLTTDRPPDERYWLEPLPEMAAAPLDGLQLELEVSAVPGLDTERVLALGSGARLDQLGRARWADNLPDVLRSVIGRSLAARGAVIGEDKRGEDCRLRIEVQAFFARGTPVNGVSGRLSATLQCRGKVHRFEKAEERAAGGAEAAAVAALQSTLDDMTRELVGWLAASGAPAASG